MLRHRGLLFAAWTTAVCILLCAIDLNQSTIVVQPKDQSAAVGETVQFNCSTNKTSKHAIVWRHRNSSAPSGSEMDVICQSGHCGDKRYSVSVNAETGAYNLIINGVNREDDGEFRCIETVSPAEYKDARLTVNEGDPATTEGNGQPSQETHPMHDTTPSKGESTDQGLSRGQIAAIVVPIVVFVVGVVIIVFVIKRWRRQKAKGGDKDTEEEKIDLNRVPHKEQVNCSTHVEDQDSELC